jgi:hypothetical protein
MIESQQSICEWADATFGVPASDASIAARALVEMAELVTACVNGEPAECIGEEIADVVIVLARMGRVIRADVVGIATAGKAVGNRNRAIETAAVAGERLGRVLCAVVAGRKSAAHCAMELLAEDLGYLARCLGIDIPAAIDRKMRINRARRWKLDGNGHGSHVEPSADTVE